MRVLIIWLALILLASEVDGACVAMHMGTTYLVGASCE
jgi:hypothetical protein